MNTVLKRIAVDMDEVIADTVAEHLIRYNRDYNGNITKEDLHGKWIWDIVSIDRHPRLEEYVRSDDFFDVLDVIPDAQRVLKKLQQQFEVFIASAAMEVPTSFNAKYRWLAATSPPSPPPTSSSAATSPSSAPTTSSTTIPASSATRFRRHGHHRNPLRRPTQRRRHRLPPRPQLARNRIAIFKPAIT